MQAKLYVFGKQCIEPTFRDNLHIPLAGNMRPGIEDIRLILTRMCSIPYSAKFSRHLYFVDWPLKAISLHNVRGMTAYRKPLL